MQDFIQILGTFSRYGKNKEYFRQGHEYVWKKGHQLKKNNRYAKGERDRVWKRSNVKRL